MLELSFHDIEPLIHKSPVYLLKKASSPLRPCNSGCTRTALKQKRATLDARAPRVRGLVGDFRGSIAAFEYLRVVAYEKPATVTIERGGK